MALWVGESGREGWGLEREREEGRKGDGGREMEGGRERERNSINSLPIKCHLINANLTIASVTYELVGVGGWQQREREGARGI